MNEEASKVCEKMYFVFKVVLLCVSSDVIFARERRVNKIGRGKDSVFEIAD